MFIFWNSSTKEDEGIVGLLSLLEMDETPSEIGDNIQLKGRLSIYREEWQVYANIVRY